MNMGSRLLRAFTTSAQRALRPTRPIAGQAIHETHPEFLGPGELAPGMAAAEFAARRDNLAKLLPPGCIAVLPSAPIQYVTGVIPYPYRQDADFYYLTGLTQPSVAVIESTASSSGPTGKMTLFVPDYSKEDERWNGLHVNVDAAVDVFGAHDAFPLSEMPQQMARIVSGAPLVYYDHEKKDERLNGVLPAPNRLLPLKGLMHGLRWRKSSAEMALMRRSAVTAAQTVALCMQLSKPGIYEGDIAARFEYECRMQGAQRMAYPQVVAGGADSCTIHYGRNDKRVHAGELLLMDAGCEMHGYASDVSRTWPVSGTFTLHQRLVYDIVHETHRQCLASCVPGATLREIHHLSVQLISEGIARLGLLGDNYSQHRIATGAYLPFYGHSVAHWLGLDTHDTPSISHDTPLRPGVVITIEPGLYIPDLAQYGPFAGIGVRIEDDVAITSGRADVLSASAPTDVDDIEKMVRNK